jgi:hypothetical protein|tara:strand:- start:187 stop:522 length:336 start_codon:yes stop_codon:yes gene_type:complete
MEQVENWMHKIRSLAPTMEKTEYEVYKCEAEVKKLQATLKLQALATGMKTTSAQDTYAESQLSLYEARLRVGVAKGALSALKVNLKGLEIGFEEWRTKQVSARKEQARYGA